MQMPATGLDCRAQPAVFLSICHVIAACCRGTGLWSTPRLVYRSRRSLLEAQLTSLPREMCSA